MHAETNAPVQARLFRPLNALATLRPSGRPSPGASLDFLDQRCAAAASRRRLRRTVEDLGQCGSARMHVSKGERIAPDDDAEDEILAAGHARALRRPAHAVAQLDSGQHRAEWAALAGTRACADSGIDALATMNANPDRTLGDAVEALSLSVVRDDLLLAGLPSGDHHADRDVFRNHALARRLRQAHGCRCSGSARRGRASCAGGACPHPRRTLPIGRTADFAEDA